MSGFGVVKLSNRVLEVEPTEVSLESTNGGASFDRRDREEFKQLERVAQELKSPESSKSAFNWQKNSVKNVVTSRKNVSKTRKSPSLSPSPPPVSSIKKPIVTPFSSTTPQQREAEKKVEAANEQIRQHVKKAERELQQGSSTLSSMNVPSTLTVSPSISPETIRSPQSSPVDFKPSMSDESSLVFGTHLAQAELEAVVGRAALEGRPLPAKLVHRVQPPKVDEKELELEIKLGNINPSTSTGSSMTAMSATNGSPQSSLPLTSSSSSSSSATKPKSSLDLHNERLLAESNAASERSKVRLKPTTINKKRGSIVNTERHSELQLKSTKPTK